MISDRELVASVFDVERAVVAVVAPFFDSDGLSVSSLNALPPVPVADRAAGELSAPIARARSRASDSEAARLTTGALRRPDTRRA
jgi:hypothetical protein